MELLIAGAFVLAACASTSPEAPPILPTPFPEIATTPELEAWTTSSILSFRDTKDEQAFIGIGLEILGLPAARESTQAGDLSLLVTAVEPPEDWFVTPLGRDSIAIVVNSENPVRDLTADEVLAIFTGRADEWQDLGGSDLTIQPVVPLEGAETRSYLQRQLLGDRRYASTALIGPTPAAVMEIVSEEPGAVGILPLSAATDGVVLVTIDGFDPERNDAYPWTLEILGMSPKEPSGVVREWLAWLQAR